MALDLSIMKRFWRGGSETDKPGLNRLSRRKSFQRKINHSFLRIREVEKADEQYVRDLLFDHFRQLTFPAIMYWMVQHVYDLLAIIAILSFLLPIKHIVYFVAAFMVYLYVRARYEMEKHIMYCCPDLADIHGTYRTAKGANFWVGYFSNQDDAEGKQEEQAGGEAKKEEANGDDSQEKKAESKSECQQSEPNEDAANAEPAPEVDGSEAPKAEHGEKQPLLARQQVSDDPPMKLKDLLNQTKCKENEILGCIGIAPYRNKSTIAQMVRLVVSKKCRSMKVGSKLLSHLEKYAINFGYTEIRVYTNNLNTAYLQFLKQNGFVIQQLVRRGLMRGDLIIWNKTLSQPDDLLVPETEAITNMGVTLILE